MDERSGSTYRRNEINTDVACDPEADHFNRHRVLPDDYVSGSPAGEQESPNTPDVELACRKRRRIRSQPICRTGGTDLQAARSSASECISGEMVKPGEEAKDPGEDEEADRKQAAVSLGARPKSHFSSRAVKARSLPPAVDKPGITFKSVEAAEEKTGPYEDGPAKKSTSATSHNDEEEEPSRTDLLKRALRLQATMTKKKRTGLILYMVKTNRGTIADAFLSRDRKWKLFQTVVNPTTSIENLLTEFNGGPVEFKSRKVRVVSEYFRPSVYTRRFINGRHSEAAPSSRSNVLRIVEVYVNLQRSSLAMDAKFVVSSVNIRIWKSTYLERQEGQAHIHGELLQCGVLFAASQAAYVYIPDSSEGVGIPRKHLGR